MRTYKFTGSKEFEVQARSLKKALRSAETQSGEDKSITGEWTNKKGNQVIMTFRCLLKEERKNN